MPANIIQLIAACLAMVLLTMVVAVLMLVSRAREMSQKRIHPQAASTSAKMARLENTQPADNFRNLFEVPVLFYLLMAIAIGVNHAPAWFVVCAWLFVALRVLHSIIHCTYNRVYHRFAVFSLSLFLLVGMWVLYFVTLLMKSTV